MGCRGDVGRAVGIAAALAAVQVALVAGLSLALAGCSAGESEPTWPDSAEFSTIETGADRFSWHRAGPYAYVVVDRQTGCQYLARYRYGMTQLTDADGSPLLVAEAGS